eukprot:scaffold35110_cov142-Isochrysis_galbana.AAC.1
MQATAPVPDASDSNHHRVPRPLATPHAHACTCTCTLVRSTTGSSPISISSTLPRLDLRHLIM